MLELFTHLLGQWKHLYSDSALASSVVGFGHLGGLLLGGGSAVAADIATLRVAAASSERRRRHLADLSLVHRFVFIGLGCTVASGALLVAADPAAFLGSTVFWGKMALMGALVGNGAFLGRTEAALLANSQTAARGWVRLGWAARVSLTLWFAVLLLGTVLTTA